MILGLLTKDQAKARLVECLGQGRVVYTAHAQVEMRNDGLTRNEIAIVCRSGVVIDAPEPDVRTGAWKYRIEGLTPNAARVVIVFTFEESHRAVFITVFRRI